MNVKPTYLHIDVPDGATEDLRIGFHTALTVANLNRDFDVVITPEKNLLIMIDTRDLAGNQWPWVRNVIERAITKYEMMNNIELNGIWLS